MLGTLSVLWRVASGWWFGSLTRTNKVRANGNSHRSMVGTNAPRDTSAWEEAGVDVTDISHRPRPVPDFECREGRRSPSWGAPLVPQSALNRDYDRSVNLGDDSFRLGEKSNRLASASCQ